MDAFSVLVAAVVGFAIGALWYGLFARQWVPASGVPTDERGAPDGANSPALYLASFVCILLVAGMMRHAFATAGIDAPAKGILGGLGVGAFFIAPWIMLNVLFARRPLVLALIDGGYAALACGAMGLVLTLM